MIGWQDFLRDLPLIAILRGVRSNEAVAIADALHQAGFLCVETPLNSPDPFASIAAISRAFRGRMLVGAGTALSLDDAAEAARAGAEFIVSPHTDPDVIRWTKTSGLISLPGAFTPSEAFAALAAGADALKLFPAELANPAGLKALKAVLPAEIPVLPVGAIAADHFAPYLEAGAAGFGLGGSIYKPGAAPEDVHRRAADLVRAFKEASSEP